MAYDPQASRRRPRPDGSETAPVEALLGESASAPNPPATADQPTTAATPEDPPPVPSVTPAPADPPSDQLLLSTGVAGILGAVISLLVARHFWRRHRRRAATPAEDD